MDNIPLDATVECTDGPCGKSTTVIIDPTGPRVTHIVVRGKEIREPSERLIPIDQLANATRDTIHLNCTKDQVAKMEPFVETRYIGDEWSTPGYWYSMNDIYMVPYATPVEPLDAYEVVERIPEGARSLHRGAWVEATDGHLGKVGELVLDPAGGNITHFTLQEGHLWGKREVTLPMNAIQHADADTIYLKLDKDAIGRLPSVGLARKYDQAKATDKNLEMVAKVYDSTSGAAETLEFVEDMSHRKVLKILDAAVLVKAEDGTTALKDTRDIDPKKGRILGAITGGLIGLVGGPVGFVVGALAGAGAGGLAGKWIDYGFSNKFLEGLQEHMQPGSSALIVLVEHEWSAKLSETLEQQDGFIFRQALTDSLVEQLLEEQVTGE